MGDHAGEDEGRQEREGENERIEEAVVPSPYTVAHPGAVMVKPFWKKAGGEGLVQAWLATNQHRCSEASHLGWLSHPLLVPQTLPASGPVRVHTFFPLFPGEGKFLFHVLAEKSLP